MVVRCLLTLTLGKKRKFRQNFAWGRPMRPAFCCVFFQNSKPVTPVGSLSVCSVAPLEGVC
jgi:hypothetical protein